MPAICAVLALATPVFARAQAPIPTAVFPFELADTSGEGVKPGQDERLALATHILVEVLDASGKYRDVDLTPFAAEAKATEPRYRCSDCWAAVARRAGAALAVIPSVHKVSTLVLVMSIWVADLKTMRWIAHVQGQIRGDTDEAYARGVRFLVTNEFLDKSR